MDPQSFSLKSFADAAAQAQASEVAHDKDDKDVNDVDGKRHGRDSTSSSSPGDFDNTTTSLAVGSVPNNDPPPSHRAPFHIRRASRSDRSGVADAGQNQQQQQQPHEHQHHQHHRARSASSTALVPVPVSATATANAATAIKTSSLHQQQQQQQQQQQRDFNHDVLLRVLASLHRDQAFLGLVAVRDQPKLDTLQLVDRMMSAGVRFVFFSAEDERRTHAFGTRINLFTGFNHFLSLRDPLNKSDEKEVYVGKSKLPRGVTAIREHLDRVDDVPLLVSLFSDCTPRTMHAMTKIYQEHGENVITLGSSLALDNTPTFQQADLAIAIAPVPAVVCAHDRSIPHSLRGGFVPHYMNSLEFSVSASITSAPCPLVLPSTADLSHFAALVAVGRQLLANARQALWFGLAAQLTVFLAAFVNLLMDAPAILEAYQMLWLVLVVIPLLSIPHVLAKRDDLTLRSISCKNTLNEEAHSPLFLLGLFLVRFLPSALAYAGLFSALVLNLNDVSVVVDPASGATENVASIPRAQHFWSSHALTRTSLLLSASEEWAYTLRAVQLFALFIFVVVLVLLSASFVNRGYSVFVLLPHRHNPVWTGAAALALVLHLGFTLLFLLTDVPSTCSPRPAAVVDFARSPCWPLLVLWPAVVLAVEEVAKRKHLTLILDDIRDRFFEFDTQLGMHSPVAKE